jgi:hypothetical protein
MDNLKKYAVVLALMVVSFSAGKFFGPKSVQTTETEHVETTTNQNTNKNQNYIETKKETRQTDGTVIIETRKEKETTTQTTRETNTETAKTSETLVESRPSYRVGVGYEPAIKGFQNVTYAVTVEKRLFADIYMGISGSSRRTIGLTLSLGF